MNNYVFDETNILKLHSHKLLALHISGEHIAFSWNKNEGSVYEIDKPAFIDFFSKYKGKLIFNNAVTSVYTLIQKLFNGEYKAREYFNNIEDVEFLKVIGGITNGYEPMEMPLQPLSNVLDSSLSLWYYISRNLPIAEKSKQIDIYKNVYQPALVERIKMALAKDMLTYNIEAKKELNQEAEDLVCYLHNQPEVVKYNAYLASQSSEQYCAIFDPLNKKQVRELLTGLGYGEYSSVYELLWSGEHENIISAICGVIRRDEYNPIIVPKGYKIKAFLNPKEPVDKEMLINQAYMNGYIEGRCGIRFNTPLAKQSIKGSSYEDPNVKKEIRVAIDKVINSKYLSDYEVLIKVKNKIPFHVGENEILFLEEI